MTERICPFMSSFCTITTPLLFSRYDTHFKNYYCLQSEECQAWSKELQDCKLFKDDGLKDSDKEHIKDHADLCAGMAQLWEAIALLEWNKSDIHKKMWEKAKIAIARYVKEHWNKESDNYYLGMKLAQEKMDKIESEIKNEKRRN